MSRSVQKRKTFRPTRSGFGALILPSLSQRSSVDLLTPIVFATSSVESGFMSTPYYRSLESHNWCGLSRSFLQRRHGSPPFLGTTYAQSWPRCSPCRRTPPPGRFATFLTSTRCFASRTTPTAPPKVSTTKCAWWAPTKSSSNCPSPHAADEIPALRPPASNPSSTA